MKYRILTFLKKYPINIFLCLIFINLITISAYLKDLSKLASYKDACSRYFAFYAYGTDKQAEENELRTAKKLKVPLKLVDAYCQTIIKA